MSTTNYFLGMVRILEPSQQIVFTNDIILRQVKAEMSQFQNSETVILKFWGKLGKEFDNYYMVGDYIIVEGSMIFEQNTTSKEGGDTDKQNGLITCFKIYPILLKSKKTV